MSGYQYPKPLPTRKVGSMAARIETALLSEISALRADGHMPTTGRFLFYRLVAAGLVDKAKKSAPKDVSMILTQLREAQIVGMSEIVDRSRGVSDFTGWSTIHAAACDSAAAASLDRWHERTPLLIVESNSLAGALEHLAIEYRVVLVPLGGQASCGFLGRELPSYVSEGTTVLYLGDWDFSGGHIERSARERLEAYAGVRRLSWNRVALTEEQVEEHNLPVTKKYDGRTKTHHDAVETEALDQRVLVPLVRDALEELGPEEVGVEENRQRAAVLAKLGLSA